MSAKIKYTKREKNQIIKKICTKLAVGMTIDDSVDMAGIHRSTFYVWLEDPDVSDKVRRAVLTCKQRNIVVIQKAGRDGDWRASGWWLERKSPEEFTPVQKQELSGPKGAPLPSPTTINLNLETTDEKTEDMRKVYDKLKAEEANDPRK